MGANGGTSPKMGGAGPPLPPLGAATAGTCQIVCSDLWNILFEDKEYDEAMDA